MTAPPNSGTYQWISTSGGVSGVGQLPSVGGTNGTLYTTSSFTANVGDVLTYYFNYVTSDGAQYADYAWAQLKDTANNLVATLLTAATKTSGDIIPGQGLPPIVATLNPTHVPIIPGGVSWAPLSFAGPNNSSCYATGCGYTGWVKSVYTITTAGTYVLQFGVSNFLDAFGSRAWRLVALRSTTPRLIPFRCPQRCRCLPAVSLALV